MPSSEDRLTPGQPIKASVINKLAEYTEVLQKLGVAPPLEMTEDATGRYISDGENPKFYGQLSGGSSPYTFVEVTPTSGGGWSTLTGGRTGSAYEVNSASGLSGVVEIGWTSAGDYRFYVPRIGGNPCTLCIAVTYCGVFYPGVTIVATKGGFSGTAVSDGQVASVTVGTAGSGYTSTPSVVFTGGGGSGAAATCTRTGGGTGGGIASVTITNHGTGYTSPPAVSFSGGAGSGTIATPTMQALACIPIPSTGTYTLSGTTPSTTRGARLTASGTAVVSTCSGGNTVNVSLGLTVVSGYECCASIPGDVSIGGPFATTLHLTDANGTHTLTYATSAPSPLPFTGSGWYSPVIMLADSNCNIAFNTCGSGTTAYCYRLECQGTNDGTNQGWIVIQAWLQGFGCTGAGSGLPLANYYDYVFNGSTFSGSISLTATGTSPSAPALTSGSATFPATVPGPGFFSALTTPVPSGTSVTWSE